MREDHEELLDLDKHNVRRRAKPAIILRPINDPIIPGSRRVPPVERSTPCALREDVWRRQEITAAPYLNPAVSEAYGEATVGVRPTRNNVNRNAWGSTADNVVVIVTSGAESRSPGWRI